jgi:hypothetical protein
MTDSGRLKGKELRLQLTYLNLGSGTHQSSWSPNSTMLKGDFPFPSRRSALPTRLGAAAAPSGATVEHSMLSGLYKPLIFVRLQTASGIVPLYCNRRRDETLSCKWTDQVLT